MRPSHEVVKPRASAEAVRDPHVQTTARTRHVVGNAAQRDRPGADAQPDDDSGSEWLASGAPAFTDKD
jgi:hypothetical protein